MTVNNPAINGAAPANLPYTFSNGDTNEPTMSAQYLIAKAMADSLATENKAKPDEQKQLLAYVENGITNALSQSGDDFASQEEFWGTFAAQLPPGSPLQAFAQNQYNLFANNPSLQKLQNQLAADEKTYADFQAEDQNMQNAINKIQSVIDWCQKHWYVPSALSALPTLYLALESAKGVKWCYDKAHAGDEANIKIDKSNIAKEEALIKAKSNSGNQMFSNNATSVIQTGDQTIKGINAATDQETGLMEQIGKLDNIKG